MEDLKALLLHEVQDLVSAEDQIIEAMPMMIEKAQNENLKKTLSEHLEVTRKQRERLDQVQSLLNTEQQETANTGFFAGLFDALSAHTCKGMEGIITEGQKIMKLDANPEVMDAAIIASAQKVEHYEICGYGTAKAYAEELNLEEVADLLDETLNEEYDADDLLTQLAVGDVNKRAEKGGRSSRGNSNRNNNKGATKSSANNKTSAPKKAAAKKAAAPKKAAAKKSAAPKKVAVPKKAVGNKKVAANNKIKKGR